MSLQAVLSRVDAIMAAQQQLVLGGTSTDASAPASADPASSTSAGTATFADALASAQTASTTPGAVSAGGLSPSAPSVSTPFGVSAGGPVVTAGVVPGAVVPQTSWNPEHKSIASWIVPVLQWASQHGWSGSVTSGYRSYQDQAAINASGAFSAPAGRSNHQTTQYPGGAVDVSEPQQLLSVLAGYSGPNKLIGGVLGAVDPEHFSATGH